jgi:hypothetical protein
MNADVITDRNASRTEPGFRELDCAELPQVEGGLSVPPHHDPKPLLPVILGVISKYLGPIGKCKC